MATFILIHGAWHGGWSFDSIAPLLEAQGHQVIAPDLPGMSSTKPATDAELAAVTLDGWAKFTAGLCEKAEQKPVILCGHSRGGLVLSQTAEEASHSIDALVYICAMLLPNGVSRVDVKAQQSSNPAFDAIKRDHPSGHASIADPEGAPAVFAQLSPPDLARQAASRMVPEPSAPTQTRLKLSDEKYGSVPRHYIECLHDLTIPIADQRMMQALQPCDSVTALDCDHSPFLSVPDTLADALLKIASKQS